MVSMSITIVLGFALRYGYASDSIVVVVQYFLLSVRTFFFLRSLFPFHPFFPFLLYVSPPPVVHAQAHDMKSCIPVFFFFVCVSSSGPLCGYGGYPLSIAYAKRMDIHLSVHPFSTPSW